MDDPLTYRIIGAAMEVHRELGPGLLESAYEEALSMELEECGLPSRRQVPVAVSYKGRPLGTAYRADLVVDDVVIELKATATLSKAHVAQVVHYVRGGGFRTGLLLNFGGLRLEHRRLDNRGHDQVSSASNTFPHRSEGQGLGG